MTPLIAFYRIPPLIIGLFFLVLGYSVIKNNPNGLLNRLLALVCLGGTLWLVSMFLMYLLSDHLAIMKMLPKIVFTGVTFIAIFYAHFTSKFLELKNKVFVILSYSFGVLSILLIMFTQKI